MEYPTFSIDKLIKESENKKIVLPNFQREFIWERSNNQKDLLTSVIYGMPIGSLLILKGESGFFATKELCLMGDIENNRNHSNIEVLYLLDGQQRISTLKSMFFDFFPPESWRENYDKLYEQLKTRWFLKVIPDDEKDNDLFGWRHMKFKGEQSINEFEPTDVSEVVEYEKIYPGKKHWYHPEFKIEKWYDEEEDKYLLTKRKNLIARTATENGLVPLYEVCNLDNKSDSEKLHYKVLSNIATKRIEDLKAKVADGEIDLNHTFGDDYDPEENLENMWNDLRNNWIMDVFNFIESLRYKEIPVIQLGEHEMTKAIYTFEYVNKGGTPLSVYDLIVAKAAHDRNQKPLTDRIKENMEKELNLPESLYQNLLEVNITTWEPNNMKVIEDGQLTEAFKKQYLNLLSIFSHCGFYDKDGNIDKNIKVEHIKKGRQLNLSANQINSNTDITVESLIRALCFLQFRCGLTSFNELRYQLMILPIAYALRNDDFWNDKKAIDKIEYWYWSSLFGGAYRERQNEQCINDIMKLYEWLLFDSENPFEERENKILEVEDYSDRETLLVKKEEGINSIPTAIKEGILQYILSNQPRDFLNKELLLNTWEIAAKKEVSIENKAGTLETNKHHIIPLGSATTSISEGTKRLRNNKSHILNSPLNLTYISSIANKLIKDKPLRDYIEFVNRITLNYHCIPDIKSDNLFVYSDSSYYEEFLQKRFDKIKEIISVELDSLKRS